MYQCYNWPKPLDFWPNPCHTSCMKNAIAMETLSLDILAMINGFEAELDAVGIDTDDETEFDEEV